MEVSTVSPSPTSPTGGEDLCEIDGTNMAIDSVTLLICLCGLAGNGAILWHLGFCIRKNHITIAILFLAFADFLFLLFLVPSTLLSLMEGVSCSTMASLMLLRFLFLLSLFSYNMGLYLLTAISIKRCISIFCPGSYCCHLGCQHQTKVENVLLVALTITVIAVLIMVTSLCLFHVHRHCRWVLVSMYALNIVLCAPFVLISHTILFIKAKCGSQQQQPKKFDIVIFLMVLFSLPLSICNFLQELGYTVVSSQVVFLLTCINSTIKPFIYFAVGSCWRHGSMGSLRKSLQRVFTDAEENTPSSNDATMDTAF